MPIAEHRAEIYEGQVCIDHEGPRFGDWLVSAETRGSTMGQIEVVGEGDPLVATDLRRIAEESIAAAEWLEARA